MERGGVYLGLLKRFAVTFVVHSTLIRTFFQMHWRTTAWLLLATVMLASADNARWFPTQTFPKSIICTVNQQEFPKPRLAHQMMVQSVAGLAAKAVNEGRGTELVWVNNGEGDLEKWY
ncbi:MAG: hypothetical protein ACXWBP_05045, partial [Limisphaerales bacterium]